MARRLLSGRGRWCSELGVRAGRGAHRRRRGRRDVGGPVLARLVVAQRGGVVAGVAVDRLSGGERGDARPRGGGGRGGRAPGGGGCGRGSRATGRSSTRTG